MKSYCKSSPHLFRLIRRAFWLYACILALAAWLIPAPLQEPANIALVPNPAKSAWFLLWIQELVSYRLWLIYPVVLAGALFTGLPWLIGRAPDRAVWFGHQHRTIALLVGTAFLGILALTAVALFCRGENWAFRLPF